MQRLRSAGNNVNDRRSNAFAPALCLSYAWSDYGRDPFNQSSNRSDREKWSTSKGGPVFSKLFRLDRTDPLGFGPKFPEILVECTAPRISKRASSNCVLCIPFILSRRPNECWLHTCDACVITT